MNFREEERALEALKDAVYDREEEPAFSCDRCSCDIYKGQEYYNYQGEYVCEDCFDDLQSIEKTELKRIAGDEDDY